MIFLRQQKPLVHTDEGLFNFLGNQAPEVAPTSVWMTKLEMA